MSIVAPGYTYCHEHLYIDLSIQKGDLDCRLDQYDNIRQELLDLKALGVSNIVEVTNAHMGRNAPFLEQLMIDTGINILVSTGHYIEGFFPPEVTDYTAQQLADVMINEICSGIEGSRLKASVIGEIGTSYHAFTPLEQKVFEAAAIAHLETGRPISTHQSLSTMGREQVMFLASLGVKPEHITIGHCDLKTNLDDICWLIEQGCYVQFDTIGKHSYYPDDKRIEMLLELKKRNYLSKVMLSMDVTRRSHLKANGGLGFSYLLTGFVPKLLENGFSRNDIDTMLITNPYTLFK
jgi:phosphotriesterase-related protein